MCAFSFVRRACPRVSFWCVFVAAVFRVPGCVLFCVVVLCVCVFLSLFLSFLFFLVLSSAPFVVVKSTKRRVLQEMNSGVVW